MTKFLALAIFLFIGTTSLASRRNPEVLARVLSNAHPGTVIVFDLDDTLIDVSHRKFILTLDFARQPAVRTSYPDLSARVLRDLKQDQVGYDVPSTTLWAIGITKQDAASAAFLSAADKYWLSHLTLSESFRYDVANPGAVDFVRAVHDTGATVVYLSGRKQKTSEAGTLSSLRQLGFPLDANAVTALRDEGAYASDGEFKVKALSRIRELGNIIAFFDNEPKNDLLMRAALPSPNVDIVFLNTSWEGTDMNKLVSEPSILWLKDFRIER